MRKCLFFVLFIMIVLESASLGIIGNAKAIGMGESMTAVQDNLNSIFYNPAAVEYNSGQNVSAGYYLSQPSDIYIAGYTIKLSDNGLLGIGTNQIGNPTTIEPNTTISYARKINDQVNIGLSMTGYANSNYSGKLGFYYNPFNYLAAGLIFNGLVKGYPSANVEPQNLIPSGFILGASLINTLPYVERFNIEMGQSIINENESILTSNAGLDLKILDYLHIRKGWSYKSLNSNTVHNYFPSNYFQPQNIGPWVESIGIGVRIGDFMLEYASIAENSCLSVSY